jgi:hypothetical protein
MRPPTHLLTMPADDIATASRKNLQKWQGQLVDFMIDNLTNENVKQAGKQFKLMTSHLQKEVQFNDFELLPEIFI